MHDFFFSPERIIYLDVSFYSITKQPRCFTFAPTNLQQNRKVVEKLYLRSSSPCPLAKSTVALSNSANRISTKLNMSKYQTCRLFEARGILFCPQSYTQGPVCVTPIQTPEETPYCLNKCLTLAFICQSFGEVLSAQDICYMFKSKRVPPSAKTKGRLKTCQTIRSPHYNVDILKHGEVCQGFWISCLKR